MVQPAAWAELARRLDRIVVDGRPGYFAAPSRAPGRDFLLFGRLGLPLAADGRKVDMILAAVRPAAGLTGRPAKVTASASNLRRPAVPSPYSSGSLPPGSDKPPV